MSESPLRTVTLTVGTAGHIDHGKTSLVTFLTGCNTDRLPEEKARGMTIDLGFATCVLPNQRRVGIVDVPGHERFIHNMVAGASGIDVVLLVVAADDGVMPQTIEHLHILRLLGVSSGMVVITKVDLVDAARVEEVRNQVVNLTAGSFLEGCPVVGFSAKTFVGFEEFHTAFVATVNRTAERKAEGPFRMHVERTFVLQGLGVIVSGIPRSGAVSVGDTVSLLPANENKVVRGIQVYGENANRAQNGECVALRLANVTREDITRGMVLAAPEYFSPTRFINAKCHLLADLDRPIKPRTAVKVHIGTAQVSGHMVLPELVPLAPGSESYVQIQLTQPVVAAPGDLFVVRQLSPVRTIGGGHVIGGDHMRMRRSRGDWVEACVEREAAFREPATALRYVVRHHGESPLTLSRLAHLAMLSEPETRVHLEPLLQEGAVTVLQGERYVLSEAVRAEEDRIVGALNRLHDAQPLSLGFSKPELFRGLEAGVARAIVDKALANVLRNQVVVENEAGLQLAARAPKLSPPQVALAARILALYEKGGLLVPREDELPPLAGAPAPILAPILAHLTQAGKLVFVSDKVILHRTHLERTGAAIRGYLREHGSLDAGACKTLLDTTRKYAIPILEYWDKHGLTRRVGDARVLRDGATTAEG